MYVRKYSCFLCSTYIFTCIRICMQMCTVQAYVRMYVHCEIPKYNPIHLT